MTDLTEPIQQLVQGLANSKLEIRKHQGLTIDLPAIKTEISLAHKVAKEQFGNAAGKIDLDKIRRSLEHQWNVYVPPAMIIEGQGDHEEWLTTLMEHKGKRPISWSYWNRYKRFLREKRKLPGTAIDELDRTTTQILAHLEDPKREGAWDRRGMVVGNVQSGKTGNFTGLINKAVDAGYMLVIVLAGVHENLRRQTQIRLDKEFRGRETVEVTQGEERIGVGELEELPTPVSLTSSIEKGDFGSDIAKKRLVEPGVMPMFIVAKKNKDILGNLDRWIRGIPQFRGGKVRDFPVLVIDDECDQASVNTNRAKEGEELEITKINKLIRSILSHFEKSSYIGYTATPFANIFIPPDARDIQVEDDLFPRDFIVCLEPPTNYFGPAQVFGLTGDPNVSIESREPLPLIREANDHQAMLPVGHKKDHKPESLPASFHKAARSFVLATAARFARGETRSHNTFMVHVSRYTIVQGEVTKLALDIYKSIKDRIETNDGKPGAAEPPIHAELRNLWETDFMPTSKKVEPAEPVLQYSDVKPFLMDVMRKLDVKSVNGAVKDELNYSRNPDGIVVVAIGGDKLSRGLTLEGLTVSYYLRTTNMYDTLMQMGRWFGYRDGYRDLCRIFTTDTLQEMYEHIAMAIEELRNDFRNMEIANATPLEFGHRVRMHPTSSMIVTARNKQQNAVPMRMSLDGRLVQTLAFDLKQEPIRSNLKAARQLADALHSARGPPTQSERQKTMRMWKDVAPSHVLAFLESFKVHPSNQFHTYARKVAEYINEKNRQGELTSWTIAFSPAAKAKGAEFDFAGLKMHSVERTPAKNFPKNAVGRANVITNSSDEGLDLTQSQYDAAVKASQDMWDNPDLRVAMKLSDNRPDSPYPDNARRARPPTQGLLVLHFLNPDRWDAKLAKDEPIVCYAFSFPWSRRPSDGITYLANEVYQRDFYLSDDE